MGRLLHLLAMHVKSDCFVVHAPSDELESLQYVPADGGYLQRRAEREGILHSIKDIERFARLLSEVSQPTADGKWPTDHPDEDARGKPKFGTFVISASGNLRAVGAKFGIDASLCRF